jgi:hypothetical protein
VNPEAQASRQSSRGERQGPDRDTPLPKLRASEGAR